LSDGQQPDKRLEKSKERRQSFHPFGGKNQPDGTDRLIDDAETEDKEGKDNVHEEFVVEKPGKILKIHGRKIGPAKLKICSLKAN
jgi:hypothetical protein